MFYQPALSINMVDSHFGECQQDNDYRLISEESSYLPDDGCVSKFTATRLQVNSVQGSANYEQGAFGVILLDQRINNPRVLSCIVRDRGKTRGRHLL